MVFKRRLNPMVDVLFKFIYSVYNPDTGHRLTDDLEIHFLEVPKWKVKSIKEIKRLDRWLGYLSRKLTDAERSELAMKEDMIREAMKAEQIFTQDDIKWREYEQREAAIRDYRSDMRACREAGIEEGIEQGIKQGIKQGMEKGLHEANKKTALRMLNKHMDETTIAELTGMSLADIHELAKHI
jgi:predicted transposase/invertase (TIGR01784 family)